MRRRRPPVAIVALVTLCALGIGARASAQDTDAEPKPEPEPEPQIIEAELYGLLATSFFWNSRPLANADAPIAALGGNGSALGASSRQSRIGLRVGIPAVAGAIAADALQVVAETDFLGGYYANDDVTFSMGHPRLRLFHARAEWQDATVVAGQDWVLFAPLNPFSLVHVAVAGFQGTGNAWSRLPQLRGEVTVDDATLAVAALAPVSSGPVSADAEGPTVARTPGPADRSDTPSVQGRVAWTFHAGDRELVVGTSGHWGRERARFGDPPQSSTAEAWGVALDAELPVLEWLTLRGELLTGANLDGFFVNADLVQGEPVPVVAGWGQVSVTAGPLALHAGGGVEDPRAPDDATLPPGAITKNGAFYGVLAGRADALTAGLEVSHLWTERIGTGRATGTQIALGLLLPF